MVTWLLLSGGGKVGRAFAAGGGRGGGAVKASLEGSTDGWTDESEKGDGAAFLEAAADGGDDFNLIAAFDVIVVGMGDDVSDDGAIRADRLGPVVVAAAVLNRVAAPRRSFILPLVDAGFLVIGTSVVAGDGTRTGAGVFESSFIPFDVTVIFLFAPVAAAAAAEEAVGFIKEENTPELRAARPAGPRLATNSQTQTNSA